MDYTEKQFFDELRRLLNILYNKNLTQTQIGILLGVTDRCVRKWERNESSPSGFIFAKLQKLCKEN